MLRNDLYSGSGTFDQLAHFMPERIYVIHKQLPKLKDGGWMEKPEFAKYIKAIKGIPERSESCADKEFFTGYQRSSLRSMDTRSKTMYQNVGVLKS